MATNMHLPAVSLSILRAQAPALPVIALYTTDIGTGINAYIMASAGAVLNLSGATVTMRMDDGLARTMTVLSAASGTVQYLISAGDFGSPGHFRGNCRISFGTDRYFTEPFIVQVEGTIP